jgi:phosphate transport system permease protein
MNRENNLGGGQTRRAGRNKCYDRLGGRRVLLCAVFMAFVVLAVFFFVGRQGLSTFAAVSPLEFFLSTRWNPLENQYGALAFIAGSIFVTALAALIGAPLGIAGALFMVKAAPTEIYDIMKPAVGLYMAIPSVVYGFIGLTVIVPFVRQFFGVPGGFGLFTAALVLGVMILPTVMSVSIDAINSVPKTLEEASLAMGATHWQTVWRVILPAALPGLLTAVILGMARAIGETMAVQMVIGNAPRFADSLFTPTSALPSEIVLEMGNAPFDSVWNSALFLMSLVLLLIALFMIVAVRKIAAGRMP